MRVIIAGSRGITDLDAVRRAIIGAPFPVTTVLSGCAEGVDQLGELWAETQGVPIERFPADWKRHGRKAGALRNLEMADQADAVIAIWDGRSHGTAHMISTAVCRGLKVFAIEVSR